ncbi:hypothetical protein ACFQ60_12850 [Streptomyces zhihengii]
MNNNERVRRAARSTPDPIALSPSFATTAARSAAVRCGLRHVARPPVPAYHEQGSK